MKEHIAKLKDARILVIGDMMLDKYVKGDVNRICPEAPVQVLNVTEESHAAGGAGNCAVNIAALGAVCLASGLIGDDHAGRQLREELESKGIDCSGLVTWNYPTIQKVRVTSQSQQLLRIDYEQRARNDKAQELLAFAQDRLQDYDLIVISDYAKGTISKELMDGLKKLPRKIIIDPKPAHIDLYRDVYLVKPNKKEAQEMLGTQLDSDEDIEKAGLELRRRLNSNILLTRGAQGMSLFSQITHYVPTQAKEVYDVTGAGDTSLAVLGAALAVKVPLTEAVTLSNHAAGIVVGKAGTASVSARELMEVFDKEAGKVQDLQAITSICKNLREQGKTIVFTNGCFDILHTGHTRLLSKAKSFGDILVLGLDTDESIQKLKGHSRPINNERERAEILSSLSHVDYIVFFEDGNPLELIKAVRPHVQVKGADYSNKEIIGKDFVESVGGRVELIDLAQGKSTTNIIEKIQSEKTPGIR